MAYFVDTSALFKRYQPEKGTPIVCRILEATPQLVFISSITLIEIISNLKRLYRESRPKQLDSPVSSTGQACQAWNDKKGYI